MQQSGFHSMSMQSVADEARVSVGLIYQYFGNKEDLLRGVVVDILEDFRDEIPKALASAGEDPRRTPQDRVSHVLPGRRRQASSEPDLPRKQNASLKDSPRSWRSSSKPQNPSQEGVAAGAFLDIDARLVAHNILLTAHGWALKHWNLSRWLTHDEYIEQELAMVLASVRVNPPAAATAPSRRVRTPRHH